ncbi:MAG TPA: class I SAM-dependent methyltransferase [Anaerolineales bacterium]|nr:class I SAM-dependent methyltransferase [Anaerolineales bacterium]
MWALDLSVILLIIVLISIIWPNFRGAPWVPTSFRLVRKMLDLAEVGPTDIVYDLGCGDGRTLVMAAKRYGAKAVGIEIDPLRYVWCQFLITVLGLRKQVKILFGDFFKHDLSEATVITCYLLQDTNQKLEQKFRQELTSGTRLVSNTFTFLGMPLIKQNSDARLYIYYSSNDI